MKERFKGETLKEAILDQQCVNNIASIAEELLKYLKIEEYKQNSILIQQNADDNHIFLILSGKVSVRINGREVATRQAKEHVGEMALIDPGSVRSATVVATEVTVVAKVEHCDFKPIADRNPYIWRRFATELSNRLRQRTQFVRESNKISRIFIGSSAEGIHWAEAIQENLIHTGVEPKIWTNSVFKPGNYILEGLEREIAAADFGVVVWTPDDRSINKSRKSNQMAPRDNVVFELGMCVGQMGRHRTFLVRPKGDLKIPSDLQGVTSAEIIEIPGANQATKVGPACTKIKEVIKGLGPR